MSKPEERRSIETIKERLTITAKVLRTLTGRVECNHTAIEPYFGNSNYCHYGYSAHGSPRDSQVTSIRPFAIGNGKYGVVPSVPWQYATLEVLRSCIRDLTGYDARIRIEDAHDKAASASLDLPDYVLLALWDMPDLEFRANYLRKTPWPDFRFGSTNLQQRDLHIVATGTEESVKPSVVSEPDPGIDPALKDGLQRLFRADEEIVKERGRKPGPMPYAEAWNKAHQEIVALRESVGL